MAGGAASWSDAAYAGSIPDIYDSCLGPFLFVPYADFLCERFTDKEIREVLETAAGTGIVTEKLAAANPSWMMTAIDLNADMLRVAEARLPARAIRFQVADAQELPFADAKFDLVVCQFGAMFFPDRAKAYSEARRVLKETGKLVIVNWDRIENNPVSHTVEQAVASLFPVDPPVFLSRTPYGYHEEELVARELRSAGFSKLHHELVELTAAIVAPRLIARGLCEGSPLGAEIEDRRLGAITDAIDCATEALEEGGFQAGSNAPLAAHLWVASNS